MTRFFATLLIATALPHIALAQASGPVEDEVVVEGTKRGSDPAMDAFLRGDFVTAEIEFEKNFSRLKRIEYNRRASIEQNASDATLGQIQEGINTTSAGGQGGAQTRDTGGLASPIVYVNKRDARQDPNTIGSGTDLGAQLYMSGLSELKQGKLLEAQTSFERALNYNKTLHDARYRLGLIALGLGETDEARKQLAKMERALKGCHSRCEGLGDREILETGIAQLQSFLAQS